MRFTFACIRTCQSPGDAALKIVTSNETHNLLNLLIVYSVCPTFTTDRTNTNNIARNTTGNTFQNPIFVSLQRRFRIKPILKVRVFCGRCGKLL